MILGVTSRRTWAPGSSPARWAYVRRRCGAEPGTGRHADRVVVPGRTTAGAIVPASPVATRLPPRAPAAQPARRHRLLPISNRFDCDGRAIAFSLEPSRYRQALRRQGSARQAGEWTIVFVAKRKLAPPAGRSAGSSPKQWRVPQGPTGRKRLSTDASFPRVAGQTRARREGSWCGAKRVRSSVLLGMAGRCALADAVRLRVAARAWLWSVARADSAGWIVAAQLPRSFSASSEWEPGSAV